MSKVQFTLLEQGKVEGGKMTDALWIAIIGILGTLAAALMGALFAYLSLKSQNKSRALEMEKQFANRSLEMEKQFAHEDKKIIANRIKKGLYLDPIYQEIISISKYSHLIEKNLSDINHWSRLDSVLWQYEQVSSFR